MASFTDVYGDGSDGAFNNGTLVRGTTYNFTTFNLTTSINLTGTGGKVIIKCQGAFYMPAAGAIVSTDYPSVKDTTPVVVDGVSYSVASTDGVGGAGGKGGDAATANAGGAGGTIANGSDGQSGTEGTGTWVNYGEDWASGGTGGYPGLGSGQVNGGGGGGGGAGSDANYAGGSDWSYGQYGSPGGSSPKAYFHNGILIIAASANIQGSFTGDGVSYPGYNGTEARPRPQLWGSGGGGGGGGGGSFGPGGLVVKVISSLAVTGTPTLAIAGAPAAAGGLGGARVNTSGDAGENGEAGTAGTAGTYTTYLVPTLADVELTVVSNIFAREAFASSSVTVDGGTAITERGFVYGPDPNPTA